jgi:glycogen debranching enzyme
MIQRYCLFIFLILAACSPPEQHAKVSELRVKDLPFLERKSDLLNPFVTAGNRVYMIGNQDGSFSDMGWHIAGEMGGLWDHPIKLLDGLSASIRLEGQDDVHCLDSAVQFINYPLGNEHRFSVKSLGIDVERLQFVPDNTEGLVMQYKLINKSDASSKLNFCVTAKSDLRPTWLADSVNVHDGQDEVHFDSKALAMVFGDQSNPWFALVGSALKARSDDEHVCLPAFNPDKGVASTLCFEVTLEPEGSAIVPVYVAGSYESEESAAHTLERLRNNAAQYLSEKIKRFQDISRRSAISTPDAGINEMYAWLKFNIDWMVREVPEEGVGLSAGLPDYPWWFGADATYSLQGVLATGDFELTKSTIQLLNKISKRTNPDGRIIHEVSTNGVVYNRGNVNETAQFITLVYNYYQWTGDSALVKELFPDIRKGIDWLTKTMDPDGNGYPNGSGMMEIPGLESDVEMIDVAVYTQQALASASVLASSLGEKALATQYNDRAVGLAKKINTQWWLGHEKSYGDFRSAVEQGHEILKAALVRADTMKKASAVAALSALQKRISTQPNKGEAAWLIYKNWVVNTPMETGVAGQSHAMAALQSSLKYQNAYGLFVTGIDKTDEPDSVVLASRKKVFSYTGAVMTLPTGVTAVGAARYGQVDLALATMQKLQRSFSYALPGSMYEVSPDFGMMTQAWNIYGIAVPLVTGFFGVQPNAPHKRIRLTPRLPSSWDQASIDSVHVGNNVISIHLRRSAKKLVCEVRQTDPTWIIEVNAADAAVAAPANAPRQETSKGLTGYKGAEMTIHFSR